MSLHAGPLTLAAGTSDPFALSLATVVPVQRDPCAYPSMGGALGTPAVREADPVAPSFTTCTS